MILMMASYDRFPYSLFKWLGLGLGYLRYKIFTHSKALKNQKFNEMIEAVEAGKGVEYYDKWIEDIKILVPQHNLLLFDVKEGWGPLCKFLGVAIPEQPFPKVNDTYDFKERMYLKRRRSWLLLYELVTLPALVCGFYFSVHKY